MLKSTCFLLYLAHFVCYTYPVIIKRYSYIYHAGDSNVAHEEMDLKNPKTNRGHAGFSDQERGKMTELLRAGFSDTFRTLYPERIAYSWWSYRFRAREKNAGWRIDYFIVSQRMQEQVREALIYDQIFGSDHCPVGLELAL